MGGTWVNFHSVGKILVLLDLLNICVSDGKTISTANFRRLHGILYRLAVFLSLITLNNFRTRFTVRGFRQNGFSVDSR